MRMQNSLSLNRVRIFPIVKAGAKQENICLFEWLIRKFQQSSDVTYLCGIVRLASSPRRIMRTDQFDLLWKNMNIPGGEFHYNSAPIIIDNQIICRNASSSLQETTRSAASWPLTALSAESSPFAVLIYRWIDEEKSPRRELNITITEPTSP